MRKKKAILVLILSISFCLAVTGSPVFSGQGGSGKIKEGVSSGRSCEEGLREANDRCYRGSCGNALPMYDYLLEKDASCTGELKGEILYGRGRAKEAVQDYRGAVADYTMALQMSPDSRKFRETLGRGYCNLGNQKERFGDLRGALADYLSALEYIPDLREAADGVAGLYYQRGLEKQQRGELRNAMEDIEKALRYKPNYPEAKEAKRNLEERMRHKAAERDGLFTF